MLSTVRGVGVADVVKEIARIADLEVEVSEEFEEDVIGGTVAGVQTPTPPPANQNQPQGDTEQQAAPNPPDNDQGVSQQVANQANVLAARIARSIREYDDLQDRDLLPAIMALKAEYEELPPGAQELVNRALTPILYNSAFLSNAAMEDMAAGYAMAAFHAAQRETDHALHWQDTPAR